MRFIDYKCKYYESEILLNECVKEMGSIFLVGWLLNIYVYSKSASRKGELRPFVEFKNIYKNPRRDSKVK